MRPEPHRVVVARIHRHPRGARCRIGQAPVAQQAGLPPARRRADDHQPGRPILAEATEEGLADHGTGAPSRQAQLRGEHERRVARTTRTSTFTPGRPRGTHPSCRADRTGHVSSGLRFTGMPCPPTNPSVSSHHPCGKLTRSRGRQVPSTLAW